MIFRRPNGQEVNIKEIAKIAVDYILKEKDRAFEIVIGTDSQSYSKTKMAEVIVVRKVGSGGIFFFRTSYIQRVPNLRIKIQEETQRSLVIADELIESIELELLEHNTELKNLNVHVQIHCDVGTEGSTKVLINEISGWVKSMGYECLIKPDSYAASTVADKYSK